MKRIIWTAALFAVAFSGALSAPPARAFPAAPIAKGSCCKHGSSGDCCSMCPSCCIKHTCTMACCDLSACASRPNCCR